MNRLELILGSPLRSFPCAPPRPAPFLCYFLGYGGGWGRDLNLENNISQELWPAGFWLDWRKDGGCQGIFLSLYLGKCAQWWLSFLPDSSCHQITPPSVVPTFPGSSAVVTPAPVLWWHHPTPFFLQPLVWWWLSTVDNQAEKTAWAKAGLTFYSVAGFCVPLKPLWLVNFIASLSSFFLTDGVPYFIWTLVSTF